MKPHIFPIRETFDPDAKGNAALNRIKAGNAPFAITKKQDDDFATILEGEAQRYSRLDEIPRETGGLSQQGDVFGTISAIPYDQINEKETGGQSSVPISCIVIQRQTRISLRTLSFELPDEPIELEQDIYYKPDSNDFAERVKSVQKDEIGKGEGSSFTISRKAFGKIKDHSRNKLLSIFNSIQHHEYGSYMNFVFHDGNTSLVGASPERHLTVRNETVTMNPISGTLRKTPDISKKHLRDFLRDPKEIMELFMVLDEELKQMAQMCEAGGYIRGPLLKEMSKVIHTEYELIGKSTKDCIELFRKTMFAPTVTGSPISSAPGVIRKYENSPRRYYSGALMLLGHDKDGKELLDSTITIRTAEITNDGNIVLQAGATITQGSNPLEEARETEGKFAGLHNAIVGQNKKRSPEVLPTLQDKQADAILLERNHMLSNYYLHNQENTNLTVEELVDKRITIIDNGDDFCYMLGHMISRMGALAKIIPFDAFDVETDNADIVLVGPGPGNPKDISDPKMHKNAVITKQLLDTKHPFLSVCLGHQILCQQLGIPLKKRDDPLQGVQKKVDLFGQTEHVGFYNTYAGRQTPTDDVYALRGKGFASFQFHPESILSQHGFDILANTLKDLVKE